MPYEKKNQYLNYDAEKLIATLETVRSGQTSQRKAAQYYDIPQSTIVERVSGRTLPGAHQFLTPT